MEVFSEAPEPDISIFDVLETALSVHIEVDCDRQLEMAIRHNILTAMCESVATRNFFLQEGKLYSTAFPASALKNWECHVTRIEDHRNHLAVSGYVRISLESGLEKLISADTGFALSKKDLSSYLS